MRQNKINWVVTTLIALGSLLILFPIYLTVSTALKDGQETAQSILSFPSTFHWENFTQAIEMTNFFQSFRNSATITICTVLLTLLTNSMVAYAIARNMHKKFFKFLYYFFLSAMFVPFAIIMLPIVKETTFLGMNNPAGLIILYMVYGLSFNIFIYVGYIKSIPKELEEAAIVDGCGPWGVFWKIIFPLLMPMNATVGIMTCLWAWNDFMLPLIILDKPDMATIPLTQYIFQSQYSTNYNLAFASYLLALSPMILVYVVAQKWIISGIMKGSAK